MSLWPPQGWRRVAYLLLWAGAGAGETCLKDDLIAELPSYACYLHPSPPRKAESPANVRVYNTFSETMTIYWDNGTPEGVYSGFVEPGRPMTTTSYVTHRFNFVSQATKKKVASVTIQKNKPYYFIGPGKVTKDMSKDLRKRVAWAVDFVKYADEYFAKTGKPFLGDYPPQPVRHPFLKAEYVGQTYNVTLENGHWDCGDAKTCGNEPLELKVVVASVSPRVLITDNFLHESERKLVKLKGKLGHASVGDGKNSYESNTRRSEVGWLGWKEPWLSRILARTAELLGFGFEELQNGLAEQLQIAAYKSRGIYNAHHDFGDRPFDRMLTFLHYIEPAEQEGATSFPLAFGGKGLKVNAEPGTSILFYSFLPDGNKDDLSIHEAMEVVKGHKTVCNSWIHDRSAYYEKVGYKELDLKHAHFEVTDTAELEL